MGDWPTYYLPVLDRILDATRERVVDLRARRAAVMARAEAMPTPPSFRDALSGLSHLGVIAEIKRANNVSTLQVSRWNALLEDRVQRAEAHGLSADYTYALYEIIHRESVRRQSEVMEHDPAQQLPSRDG